MYLFDTLHVVNHSYYGSGVQRECQLWPVQIHDNFVFFSFLKIIIIGKVFSFPFISLIS